MQSDWGKLILGGTFIAAVALNWLVRPDDKDTNYYDCKDVTEECECKFGFKRKEFKAQDPLGNLGDHFKHLFVCSGQKSTEWPKRVEDTEFGTLITNSLKAMTKTHPSLGKIKLSFIEDHSRDPHKGFDVIVFPDSKKYFCVNAGNVDEAMRSICGVSITSTSSSSSSPMVTTAIPYQIGDVTGTWIFVCCHHSRDERCSTCGPRIFKKFSDHFLTYKDYHVKRVSHLGQHMFAANVLIYQKNNDPRILKYFGDFYGFVSLEDVDKIIEQHLMHGKIVRENWLGRCDCSKDTAKLLLKFQQK